MQEDKLCVAARHVAIGRRIVARQRAVMARLKENGWSTVEAMRTLALFEQTFALTRAAQSFKFHQPINSNPLIISIATAVPPCMPNATVLLPPWCNTITASAIGMRVAASMNQPRTCADP
jgi:hypothetical protein